ncbi:MAG: tetratricopeptide repeat protein [Hydrogenovibrio sp.]
MSLLLEALRKAAMDKKAAEGQETGGIARPGDLPDSPVKGKSNSNRNDSNNSRSGQNRPPQTVQPSDVSDGLSSEQAKPGWSLSRIPGYSSDSETVAETVAKTAIRFSAEAKSAKPQETMPTPEQVRAFLAATAAPAPAGFPRSGWGLAVLIGLLLLVGIGYYGFGYYQRQMQAIQAEHLAWSPAFNPATSEVSVPAKSVPPKSVPPSLDGDEQPPMAVSAAATTAVTEPAEPDTRRPSGKSAALGEMATQTVTKPASPKAATPVSAQPESLQKNAPLAPHKAALQISRVSEPSQVQQAFDAYASGDYERAEALYQAVYQRTPDALPVLFGLAALAVKQGRKSAALGYYQRILQLNPDNKAAKNAMVILAADQPGLVDSLQALEDRAVAFPQDARLQAALGHRYAKDGNWTSAQQQYFMAYELAPSRGDYALNLAVSLDQLGEYALAHEYYQRALQAHAAPLTLAQSAQARQRQQALQVYLKAIATPSVKRGVDE